MAGKALTDRKLKALARKPAAPRTTYGVADGVVPGLAVRVHPTGKRSFVLVARFPGANGKAKNPTRRLLGSYGALTLEQAREKARAWLELIDRGVDPKVEQERQRQAAMRQQATSFAAVAEQFINPRARFNELRKALNARSLIGSRDEVVWAARTTIP